MSICNGQPALQVAAPERPGGLRGRRAAPQLHPRGARAGGDAGGREPADSRARGSSRGRIVPAPAPGAGADAAGAAFAGGGDHGPRAHRQHRHGTASGAARRRGHRGGQRQLLILLADVAHRQVPRRLPGRRDPPRRRRAGRRPGGGRDRPGGALWPGRLVRRRGRPPDEQRGLSGVYARAISRVGQPLPGPPTCSTKPCSIWSNTTATG